MDALEQITYQTAQMVARETGALVDRMEQCIDMNGPPLLMSGEELYREKGPRQALSGALSLEVLVANRVENGTRIFKLATVVEERGKVFIFHAAFALWKRHISSLVLHQMPPLHFCVLLRQATRWPCRLHFSEVSHMLLCLAADNPSTSQHQWASTCRVAC